MESMTRREWLRTIAAGPLLAAEGARWTTQMDQALIRAAVAHDDESFDGSGTMLRRQLDQAYRIHTTLRGMVAHPTRESLSYAHLLLEAADPARLERAQRVIEAVIAAQDTDPSSKTFGLWGYYLEEPPQKMSPPDFNWADFNGATLALILHRHRRRLSASVVKLIGASLERACESIRRRNVAMSYTNIAVQGTFVTLAAAELLASTPLQEYARDRLRRLMAEHEKTGSFAEFNSPTYMRVTIANLTRIRMVVKNAEALEQAGRLEDRAWLHLARHWHPPTKQLAGPMSRCYSTLLGHPLWLQKATGNRLQFVPPDRLTSGEGGAETGTHDFRCPERYIPGWLSLDRAREHREWFASSPAPVVGTTWLDPRFTLGSANRLDFWEQRRPLIAYWGSPDQPRYLRLRFLKDDHDFASALFFGVQQRGLAIGAVTFRSPGGDRHPSLDLILGGQFSAGSLALRFEFNHEVGFGNPISSGDVTIGFRLAGGCFGKRAVEVVREPGFVDLVLHSRGDPPQIAWADVGEAFVAFVIGINTPAPEPELKRNGVTYRLSAGPLAMTFGPRIQTAAEHNAAFQDFIDGRPGPVVRLG